MKPVIKITIVLWSLFSGTVVASDIASEILNTYLAISSYRDSGTATVEMRSKEGFYSVTEISFETEYTSDGDLYFAWEQTASPQRIANSSIINKIKTLLNGSPNKEKHSFWRKGTDTFSEYPGGKEREENICSAYAGATGISNGIAAHIPRYLVADECYEWPYTAFPNAKNLGLTEGGLLVELTYHTGQSENIYLDPESLLLTKVESEFTLKSGTRVKKSIHYNVEFVEYSTSRSSNLD